MNPPKKEKPPDFDEEFMQAVAKWRELHKLPEEDAVLLLIDLFRIHQKHWDALRSRDLPAFNQFRTDIGLITQAAKIFQNDTGVLIALLKNQSPAHKSVKVSRAAAFFAALACLLAGFIIRVLWP